MTLPVRNVVGLGRRDTADALGATPHEPARNPWVCGGLSVDPANRLEALWVVLLLKKKIIQNQYYESKESLFVTNMKKTRIVVDGRH